MGREYWVEKLPARRYYGRHATGWVLLVNGHPHHFTDKRSMEKSLKHFTAICTEGGARVGVAKNG